jgi:hypothetical protein
MGSGKMRNCGEKYIRQAPTLTNKRGSKGEEGIQQIVFANMGNYNICSEGRHIIKVLKSLYVQR